MNSNLRDSVERALRMSVPKPLAGMKIEPQHQLHDDLGIDSLGLITLAMLLDEALGVKMSAHLSKLAAVETVRDLEALAHSLVTGRQAELA
jgi:acyl carrier protein